MKIKSIKNIGKHVLVVGLISLLFPLWSNKVIAEKKDTFPNHLDVAQDNTLTDYNLFPYLFQTSLQKRSLSCESAATSDIISWFKNKHISEDTIIDLLPKDQHFDRLPEILTDGTRIWWNPDLGFVGYIDSSKGFKASQSLLTGYWVHEKPIADAYSLLWYRTKTVNKYSHSDTLTPEKHLNQILIYLYKWNMVQLWWDWCTKIEYEDGTVQTKHLLTQQQANEAISAKNECWNVDQDRSLSWKYRDSSWKFIQHTWLNGQHAFVLLWWKGNIKDPTHIRVWDTDTGYHEYETIEWMRKWKAMDYRSIIVSE